jgi:hypothetical protein
MKHFLTLLSLFAFAIGIASEQDHAEQKKKQFNLDQSGLAKRTAVIASFISRFSIGFIIFNLNISVVGWLKGVLVGLVLSLPDALITKQYKPILGSG